VLGLGFTELLFIAGGILLLFGAKKIPGLAKGIGQGIRNFRGEVRAPLASSEPDGPKKLKGADSGETRREP
jgi:sec-independent protein translocase protein TatA